MSVLSNDIKRSILHLSETGLEAFQYIIGELAEKQYDSAFKMLTNVFEMCAEVEQVLCDYCLEDTKLSCLTNDLKQGFQEALGHYEKRDSELTKVIVHVVLPGYILWVEHISALIDAC